MMGFRTLTPLTSNTVPPRRVSKRLSHLSRHCYDLSPERGNNDVVVTTWMFKSFPRLRLEPWKRSVNKNRLRTMRSHSNSCICKLQICFSGAIKKVTNIQERTNDEFLMLEI